MGSLRVLIIELTTILQRGSLLSITCVALGSVETTGLSVSGHLPWVTIYASYDGQPIPRMGMYVQIGLTAFALMLLFYLPANARILALATSHRTFNMTMTDVARATDGTGVFHLSSV